MGIRGFVVTAAAAGLVLALTGCATQPGTVCADSGQDNRVQVVVPAALADGVDSVAVCTDAGCDPAADGSASSERDGDTWSVTVPYTLAERGAVALRDADGTQVERQDVDLEWTDFAAGAPLQCKGAGKATVWLEER